CPHRGKRDHHSASVYTRRASAKSAKGPVRGIAPAAPWRMPPRRARRPRRPPPSHVSHRHAARYRARTFPSSTLLRILPYNGRLLAGDCRRRMNDGPMTSSLDRLLSIMARLRDPKHGCPWDREQDFATIAPYTIEEAYEVADAIARGDMGSLKEELG